MHIIYHNDLDGQAAAYWVRKFKNKLIKRNEQIYYYPISHSSTIFFNQIYDNELVVILDILPKEEDMNYISSNTNNIIWIDHHITNINKYKSIEGIRNELYSACSLSYAYFSKMIFTTNDFNISFLEEEPLFNKYICDNDIRANIFKDSDDFCFGIEYLLLKNDISIFKLLDKYNKSNEYENIIKMGKTFKEMSLLLINQQIKKYGYTYKYQHLNFLIINSMYNNFNIDDFNNIEKYDGIINYIFVNNHYIVNIKTKKDNVDVAAIAKSFGGGGHTKSAGFSLKNNIFSD